jgi:hypothetical protein
MRLLSAASIRWSGLGLTALLLSSCGPNPNAAAARGDKLFQSAPSETRAIWATVTASMKSNDFALALTSLGKLHSNSGLSPEQKKAVEDTSMALSDKMYNAANKGDANAKKALEDLRKLQGR